MFGLGKKRDQWMEEFSAFERKACIELALAMVEEGLQGEARDEALTKIIDAVLEPEPEEPPRRKFLGLF